MKNEWMYNYFFKESNIYIDSDFNLFFLKEPPKNKITEIKKMKEKLKEMSLIRKTSWDKC